MLVYLHVKNLALIEKNIIEIKKDKDIIKNSEKLNRKLKWIKNKLILFFFITLLFSNIFWYYYMYHL